MSCSQFFVEAVKLFLRKNGDRGVTERLDEVCAKAESKVDPGLSAMQLATMRTRDSG
jgi:hypothetical protein